MTEVVIDTQGHELRWEHRRMVFHYLDTPPHMPTLEKMFKDPLQLDNYLKISPKPVIRCVQVAVVNLVILVQMSKSIIKIEVTYKIM